MRAAAIACATVFVVLVAVFTAINAREPDSAELVRRCEACRPAWNGYQEDIKEIGAQPVARWRGRPVALAVLADEVTLTMALEPPWQAWDAALPLLLMDPEGQVYRNIGDVRSGDHRIYRFPPVTRADLPPPPWLEIQYPHVKRRLHLDAAGRWQSEVAE